MTQRRHVTLVTACRPYSYHFIRSELYLCYEHLQSLEGGATSCAGTALHPVIWLSLRWRQLKHCFRHSTVRSA